jgi:hypothetical protein
MWAFGLAEYCIGGEKSRRVLQLFLKVTCKDGRPALSAFVGAPMMKNKNLKRCWERKRERNGFYFFYFRVPQAMLAGAFRESGGRTCTYTHIEERRVGSFLT